MLSRMRGGRRVTALPHLSGRKILTAPAKMILVDLENVGSRALQESMSTLHEVCAKASVVLRTYTAQHNRLAKLATTTVASSAKNAVDVRIAFDIGRTSLMAGPGSRFLVVTGDQFGRALAEVGTSTDHATLESPLPRHWRNLLGVPSLGAVVGAAVRARVAEQQLGELRNPASEPEVSSSGCHCHVCGVTVERESLMREHLAGKRHQRALGRRAQARTSA